MVLFFFYTTGTHVGACQSLSLGKGFETHGRTEQKGMLGMLHALRLYGELVVFCLKWSPTPNSWPFGTSECNFGNRAFADIISEVVSGWGKACRRDW